MNDRTSIYETLVSELTRTGELFRLSATEARLLAILYVENRPITLEQMGDLIGKSKTSVHIAIRNLSHQELVDRVWVKGARKDFYTSVSNVYKKLMTSQIEQWRAQTNRQVEIMQYMEKSISDNDPEFLSMQEQVSSSLQFHKQTAAIIKKITAISSC
ncbi:GbsR/MarR family transcriptional regulator [Terribacillus saccharophilus]|uniref:GbsR/MarR family transcriptional regulator n=1 Tax=Terribacillus saccharophilus TaxID=361277 RepID=UPI0037FD9B6E